MRSTTRLALSPGTSGMVEPAAAYKDQQREAGVFGRTNLAVVSEVRVSDRAWHPFVP